jgi:hypothetical protein
MGESQYGPAGAASGMIAVALEAVNEVTRA